MISNVSASIGAIPPAAPVGKRKYRLWKSAVPVAPPPVEPSGAPSLHIHCKRHSAPNWFTAEGVNKKRAEIENKGLPSFKHWRFITLTLDPKLFVSPLEAYFAGKDRMRYFLKQCRDSGLWSVETKWCWKMEFHKDTTFTHWHLLVGRKSKFTHDELQKLTDFWSLGRVSVEMVRNDDFLYSFKYAFKPAYQRETDEQGNLIDSDDYEPEILPTWWQDYFVPAQDGKKPKSLARARFWQTSKGFYQKDSAPAKPRNKSFFSVLPAPVREAVSNAARKVVVVARNHAGRYVASAVLLLSCSFSDLSFVAAWHSRARTACFLDVHSFVLPVSAIKQNTNKTEIHKLCKLTKKSRLTLRKAESLAENRVTLRTC